MSNLRTLREQKKLSQKECAEQLGLKKASLGFYERGKVSPSVETLFKIADYFGVSIDYLLGHETKGIIHTDSFNAAQQNIIESIRDLDEDLCGKAEAYIEGLKETQQERDTIRRIYSRK